MASTAETASTATLESAEGDVSLTRQYVLRATYLLLIMRPNVRNGSLTATKGGKPT